MALITFLISGLPVQSAHASQASPSGIWKTTSKSTGKPEVIVRIWENGGVLYGKMVRDLTDPAGKNRCDRCSEKNKDKPAVGMTVLWGFGLKDIHTWENGHVPDPGKGKKFRSHLTLGNNGKTLEVRCIAGIAFGSRTRLWQRTQ